MSRFNIRLLISFSILVVFALIAGKGILFFDDPSKDIEWDLKFIIIAALNIGLLIALLMNYEKNKFYIPYVLAFYISQTGFTYAIKPGYLTSANEALTVAILITWAIRMAMKQKQSAMRPYFSRNVKIFLALSVIGIVTAYFVFQVRPLNIFIVCKSYTLYLFYLYLIPDCIQSEKDLRNILIFVLIFSLFPLYRAVMGGMAIENIEGTRLDVIGWGALNIFVGYILPIFFIAFGLFLYTGNRWHKSLIVLYMATIVYVLFLSQTRTGWAGLIAGSALFIFLTKRKMMAIAVGLVLVIGLVLSPVGENVQRVVEKRIIEQTINPDHSLRERYSRWETAWATATSYPVTGSGWGALLPVAWDGSVGDTSTTLLPLWHNAYLELLSQLGIPGLIAFLLLWMKIVTVEGKNIFRSKQSQPIMINTGIFIGVITCLIYALAEQQFYRIETASHTYFLTGLLLAASNIMDKRKVVSNNISKVLNSKEPILGSSYR